MVLQKIGLLLVQIGEFRAKMLNLGSIVEEDVGLHGMQFGVILMISLRRIKPLQRHDLSHDLRGKDASGIELSNVGLGDVFLFIVRVEDDGSVLRALVRALAVELGRIQRNREEDAKQLPISDLGRIVDDLDRLGVAGFAGADGLVFGGLGRAARVAGGRADHPLYVLEHGLDAPEASSGNDGRLPALSGSAHRINHWRWHGHGSAGFSVAPGEHKKRPHSDHGATEERRHSFSPSLMLVRAMLVRPGRLEC
jgi:hypothetical protein